MYLRIKSTTKPHKKEHKFFVVTNDSPGHYLHKNLKLRPTTEHNNEWTGYYSSKKEAQEIFDAFLEKYPKNSYKQKLTKENK